MKAVIVSIVLALIFTASADAVSSKGKFKCGPLAEVVYADGSTYATDEKYAVVFTASGHDFAGFTTDGKLKDSTISIVHYVGNISSIKSKAVTFSFAKTDTDSYKAQLSCTDGVFELYLLDSRIEGGCAEIDSTTKLPKHIGAWAKANGSDSILLSKITFTQNPSSSGTLKTTTKTVIGTFIPVPVIAAFSVVEGVASVGATNTVATANYVLEKASDVGFTNIVWTSTSKAGAASKTTALTFSDSSATGSAAFYQIKVVK